MSSASTPTRILIINPNASPPMTDNLKPIVYSLRYTDILLPLPLIFYFCSFSTISSILHLSLQLSTPLLPPVKVGVGMVVALVTGELGRFERGSFGKWSGRCVGGQESGF